MAVNSFWTKSRLKVVVYTRFKRHKVIVQKTVPKLGPLGEVLYDKAWYLTPK